MSNRKPKMWSTLMSDEGTSIVVPEGTEPTEALLAMLWECGGDFTAENPVVKRVAADLKVEVWRSCSKAYIEAEVFDDCAEDSDWWAPGGDGKRSIHVVYYDGPIYALYDEAEAAREATADV